MNMSMLDLEIQARGLKSVSSKLEKYPVLVVGAGGIGCELLKTLVQTGFQNITVIDLDTIDVSNLNRQFLFRKKHVGQSKAEISGEVVKTFSPNSNLKVTSYHANVKEERFDVEFFKKFGLVLNALDNVNARQHVNRMCLSANIPLVDAGTTGYLGQTMVIKKGETRCYDCEPKREVAQQRFPICTIRSTPDKPVHCIVWAKELFKLMFGVAEESDLVDLPTADDTNNSTSKPDESKSVVMQAVKRFSTPTPSEEELDIYCKKIFDAVFKEEIQIKLDMRDGYKTAKFKPKPLDYQATKSDHQNAESNNHNDVDGSTRRIWSLKECVEEFEKAIKEIWIKNGEKIGSLTFDKDDDLAIKFVTAASNLRSHVFGIERKSLFDTKGIAGNIIHAIATTNAIVAGMQVLEAIRLIGNVESKVQTCDSKFVWVNRIPIGAGMLLQPTDLELPIPSCVACGQAEIQLFIDLKKATLGDVVNKVLKRNLGITSPIVMLGHSVIYECGEGLEKDEIENYEANLVKILEKCPGGGLREGSQLSIEDCFQNLKFQVIMHHKERELDEAGELKGEEFSLSGERPQETPEVEPNKSTMPSKEDDDDDDDIEVVIDEPPKAKKAKMSKKEEEDDNIVIIE